MSDFNGPFLFPAHMDFLGKLFREALSSAGYAKVTRDFMESSESLDEEAMVVAYLDGFSDTMNRFIELMDNYDDAGAFALATEVSQKSREPGAMLDMGVRGRLGAARMFSRKAIEALEAS